MLAGIHEILIISTPEDLLNFENLLGDGCDFSIKLGYIDQPSPEGLAQAFTIGEDFIDDSNVCLVLDDNIFYGQNFTPKLKDAVKKAEQSKGATAFSYQVKDLGRFGVVEFEENNKAICIEEKPSQSKSSHAATSLYFYDNDAVEIAKQVKSSHRGVLEITSVNQAYLERGNLNVEQLSRGFTWLDTGTYESLLEAGLFVETIEKRQGYKIACLKETVYKNVWLTMQDIQRIGNELSKNGYGQYLLDLLESR